MKKKISLALIALLAVVGSVAAISAFEAHVINVTAQIENALEVSTEPIDFGTVFPNEIAYETLTIALSDSFATSSQNRLDDVEYKIVQKPKPVPGTDGTTDYCIGQKANLYACIADEMDDDATLQEAILACYGGYDTDSCYPSLCQFLSKHPEEEQGDVGVGAPHPIAQCMDGINNDPWEDNDIDYPDDKDCVQYGDNSEYLEGDQPQVYGMLAKSLNDLEDIWTLDLDVPCFIGQCRQGELGLLPPEWESETFGCDLWVEVTGFSTSTPR